MLEKDAQPVGRLVTSRAYMITRIAFVRESGSRIWIRFWIRLWEACPLYGLPARILSQEREIWA